MVRTSLLSVKLRRKKNLMLALCLHLELQKLPPYSSCKSLVKIFLKRHLIIGFQATPGSLRTYLPQVRGTGTNVFTVPLEEGVQFWLYFSK